MHSLIDLDIQNFDRGSTFIIDSFPSSCLIRESPCARDYAAESWSWSSFHHNSGHSRQYGGAQHRRAAQVPAAALQYCSTAWRGKKLWEIAVIWVSDVWCAVLDTVVTRTRIWQSAGGGRHSAATQPLDTRYINTADRYTDNMSLWQVPSCGRDRSLTPDSWQSPPSSHRLAFVQTQHIYISIDIYTRIFSVSFYLCIYNCDNNDLLVSESEADECAAAQRPSTNK